MPEALRRTRGASRARRALIICTGIFAFASADRAGTFEKIHFGDENFKSKWLAAVMQSAGVLPIDPRDGDQVRIWYDNVMGRKMTGYIVTKRGVWRCRVDYRNDNGEYMVAGKGYCGTERKRPEKLAKALTRFPEGPDFDGKFFGCGTLDGWDADIEGIVGGKRFAFQASNTNGCEAPEIIRVDGWIHDIAGAWFKEQD